MSSTNFHILKSLHDSLIINVTRYISFNVYNQAIIHPLNVEQIMEQILILFAKKIKKKKSLLLPTHHFPVYFTFANLKFDSTHKSFIKKKKNPICYIFF